MTAPSLSARIEAVLAAHPRRNWKPLVAFKAHGDNHRGWFCTCGHYLALGEEKSIAAHRAHVAAQIVDEIGASDDG